MPTVCSWCRTTMSPGPRGITSHGMCPGCYLLEGERLGILTDTERARLRMMKPGPRRRLEAKRARIAKALKRR